MIIGISGKMGSGKDTLAKHLQTLDKDSNWQIKKFATGVKKVASLLLNVPISKFEDQDYKQQLLGPEWNYDVELDRTIIHEGVAKNLKEHHQMSVREFLQRIGTDAMRCGLHVNTWVNMLMTEYKKEKNSEEEYTHPNWLITDVRFLNEYEAIKKAGGIIIRINRPDMLISNHISETALDGQEFDYVINNDGEIIKLISEGLLILKKLKEK